MNDPYSPFEFLHAPYRKPRYDNKIPEYDPSFQEISMQMRINADLVMKEISDHVDKELKRFKEGVKIHDA